MAVERVVVKVEFGVEGQQPVVRGDHEGIDLHQRAVGFGVGLVERSEKLGRLRHQRAAESQGCRDFPGLVGLQPEERIHRHADDFFGGVFRNGLDVHPAFSTGDDHRSRNGPVEEQRKIEFAGNIHRFSHQELADKAAFRPGLVGDEHLTEHLFCQMARLRRSVAKVYPSLEPVLKHPFSTSAGVDLRLDDDLGDSQLRRYLFGFLRGGGGLASR